MSKPTFTTKPPAEPRPPKDGRPEWKPWHKWTIGILGGLFVVIVIAAAASGPVDDATEPNPAAAKTKAAKPRTFKQYLDDGGVDDIVNATCNGKRMCFVTIDHSTAGFGSDKDEVIRATFKAQQVAWDKKPRPTSVNVDVRSEIVSVGGKERKGVVLNVLCDRAAADEIDWKNVEPDGVEQLCVVAPRVRFDD